MKNGIYVKDSGFLNNNTWKNDLEKVLGSVAINDIKNHISQSSEGYEVKLEAKYDNNGKIKEINIVKLTGQSKEEINVLIKENQLRSEQGLNERASYGIYGR